MNVKRLIFLILGCICLGLGTLGIVLPVLPTVPFYMATLFCFTQSSRRLHDWFIQTDLYKKNLESYVKKEGMTKEAKMHIIGCVSIVMGISAGIMFYKGIWMPCVILGVVWIVHLLYFGFRVKTIEKYSA